MALRSLIQLRGLLESLPGGSKNIYPPDIQNNTPPSFELQDYMQPGDNTIIVPVNAIGCIIIFDPASTVHKVLKGIIGDTGFELAKNKWNVITFPTPPPVDFIISLGGGDSADTKITTIIFF